MPSRPVSFLLSRRCVFNTLPCFSSYMLTPHHPFCCSSFRQLQGFKQACAKGPLYGSPITGVRYVLEDGAFHAVDSSELAFVIAAVGSVREAFQKAAPTILEPIMSVEVIAPTEFQGALPSPHPLSFPPFSL